MATSNAPVIVAVGATTDDGTLTYAAVEAQHRRSPIVLFHAYRDNVDYPLTNPLISTDARQEVGRDLVESAAERIRPIAGDETEVRTHLADQGIVHALIEASQDASVIVLRRRDLSRLDRVFTGSIITGVAARAACPVVSVPAGWDATVDHHRIVAGLDHTSVSPEVLDAAFALADARKAVLDVVHAWRPPTAYDAIVFARTTRDGWASETRERVEKELEPWRSRYPDVTVEVHIEYEAPASALAKASADADLLVVGRRTRPLPRGLALGSVTRALIQAAVCPILIAPHPDDVEDSAAS